MKTDDIDEAILQAIAPNVTNVFIFVTAIEPR